MISLVKISPTRLPCISVTPPVSLILILPTQTASQPVELRARLVALVLVLLCVTDALLPLNVKPRGRFLDGIVWRRGGW